MSRTAAPSFDPDAVPHLLAADGDGDGDGDGDLQETHTRRPERGPRDRHAA
ncbi:hypothetical protein ACFWAY_22215 [Rhodococcus sp. NPDC059968]|uniref:hypothetical protein n=1 Tax=Rhodococcus sp. NPDC059968 TaxID=3347017 RepID=UPI00366C3D4D